MDRIFKKTEEFCLLNGDILDYDSPVDESKVSKVNRFNKYNIVKPCNEFTMGQILSRYPQFLVAQDCEILQRFKQGDTWDYSSERDEYIFGECSHIIDSQADKIEVYVYQKSGYDLEHYLQNSDKLEQLLTRNGQISLLEGINELMLYFGKIASILRLEQIVHKDIKPGNLIVGDNLEDFPENIQVIDLGITFQYKSFPDFLFQQTVDIYSPDVYGPIMDELSQVPPERLPMEFALLMYKTYYNNDSPVKQAFDKMSSIYSVLTNVATPNYSAPEFSPKVRYAYLSPTLASVICPDHSTMLLELRTDVIESILTLNSDFTGLVELFLSTSTIEDGYFDIVKQGKLNSMFIDSLLKYNETFQTNYNVFEFLYIISNGLTGPDPILYKYDLYCFGLILKNILKLLETPLSDITGGSLERIPENYRSIDEVKDIINHLSDDDCIRRWSVSDLLRYYKEGVSPSPPTVMFRGQEYILGMDPVTEDSIIQQVQLVDPNINQNLPEPEPSLSTEVDWNEIKRQLRDDLGYKPGRIARTIARMKRTNKTSIDQL